MGVGEMTGWKWQGSLLWCGSGELIQVEHGDRALAEEQSSDREVCGAVADRGGGSALEWVSGCIAGFARFSMVNADFGVDGMSSHGMMPDKSSPGKRQLWNVSTGDVAV